MKLLTALCDALGFEVEKVCVNEAEFKALILAGKIFGTARVYEYKLTKRDDTEYEDADFAGGTLNRSDQQKDRIYSASLKDKE